MTENTIKMILLLGVMVSFVFCLFAIEKQRKFCVPETGITKTVYFDPGGLFSSPRWYGTVRVGGYEESFDFSQAVSSDQVLFRDCAGDVWKRQ